MKRLLPLIILVASCTSTIAAATMAWPIQVSTNGRYFVDRKGQPVFWLGTTQWELFRGYTLEDAQLILDKSKDKGFVFVQTMLVGVGDGTRTSVYGQKPWLNDDPRTPNEAYFRNADAVVAHAGRIGSWNVTLANLDIVRHRHIDRRGGVGRDRDLPVKCATFRI